MNRRSSLVLTSLLTAGLALSACGSNTLATDNKSSAPAGATTAATVDPALAAKLPAKIKAAGKILVGTDATYAPNEFLDTDGKTVVGMDVDIFNAVAAKFGVTVEYAPAAFGEIILGVNSSKFDVGVSSFTINTDREAQSNMISYFNAGTQWAVAKGNPKGINIDNACGLSIGVQKDTVQVDDLKARSKKCTDAGKQPIDIVIDADQGKVTANLVSGRTVAMLADSPVGLYAVSQTDGQLEALGGIYDAAPYGFVVPKDQTDFAQAIADALKAAAADGSYKAALEKWGNGSGAITDFAVNPVK